LTVRGHVPLGQLKQFAESIVSRVDGVIEVINRIEVVDPVRGSISAPAARNAG
jgi:osmotically-inducible protein OsmY